MHRVSARGSAAARALAAALGLAAAACGARAAPEERWNVVVVVLDTVRADHLGLYGYDRPTTPRLDRFAESTVVFENAQSSAPWTAPSMISLVTSLHPAVHGVLGFPEPDRLSAGAPAMGELLEEEGYDTAAFTEGGYAKGAFGLDRGMDVFPAQPSDAESHLSNLQTESRLEENLDRALDWLAERGPRPFFLLFHTYEAHVPYYAPNEYVRLFRPGFDSGDEHERLREAIERWNEGGEWTRDDAILHSRHEWHCLHADLPEIERPDEQAEVRAGFAPLDAGEQAENAQYVKDLYDAELRFADERLARLWDALEDGGHLARSIVVVLSDHGEGFGEHGHYAHGTVLHEELLRVALLLRAPGLAPRRVEPVVRLVDVLPTVLDLTGVPAPDVLQGVSLAPWLRGAEPPPELASFSHGLTIPGDERRLESVRRGRWRLIAVTGTEQLALHDLESDPGELRDVSAEHPDVARELLELLERQRREDATLRERLGEPIPLPPLGGHVESELEALGYED